MSDLQDILVPDVGGEEVEIIEICVDVGDSIEEEMALITVESDKASMDIPAPFAGTLSELSVSVGDKISEGMRIGAMTVAGAASPAPVAAPVVETAAPAAPAPSNPDDDTPRSLPRPAHALRYRVFLAGRRPEKRRENFHPR